MADLGPLSYRDKQTSVATAQAAFPTPTGSNTDLLNGNFTVMKLRPKCVNAVYKSSLARSLLLPYPHSTFLRQSSSSTLSSLSHELKSRPLNITYDYISPTPSHLLNVSLQDFLPSSCQAKDFDASNPSLPYIAPADSHASRGSQLLHPGHHLVYFPPSVPQYALLPDGTDILHSPAAPTPFTRRLWAGGSVTFNSSSELRLYLDGARAACVEGIRDVMIKGREGDEKIFVHIERRYGYVNPSPGGRARHEDEQVSDVDVIRQLWKGNQAGVIEKRNLVFLRARESGNADEEASERVLKPTIDPDFSVSLTPTASLLFRFSALTFNAHLIHLDPCYSREVEGLRDLLVHGPLSLVLMLNLLQSRLKDREMITSITYRNLAPLFSGEEMRLCLRKAQEDAQNYEIWIEAKTGGYAVKGSATVGSS